MRVLVPMYLGRENGTVVCLLHLADRRPPLRAVFETALGLPSSFGAIDLDQQLSVFKDRSEAAFGSSDPAQFVEEDARDTLIRRFFALGSINQSGPSGVASASAALTLLQSAPVPPLT